MSKVKWCAPGPVSIIATGAVKTKLMSVFATKFARDIDAETLAPLRSFVYTDDQ